MANWRHPANPIDGKNLDGTPVPSKLLDKIPGYIAILPRIAYKNVGKVCVGAPLSPLCLVLALPRSRTCSYGDVAGLRTTILSMRNGRPRSIHCTGVVLRNA